MKAIKIVLPLVISLFLVSVAIAQTLDCNAFCVTAIEFDTVTSPPFKMLNVTVQNNGQTSISYFTVYSVIDDMGDTIANGESSHFILPASGAGRFDLPALVDSIPSAFKGKVVVGVLHQDTCVLNFPCMPEGVPAIRHFRADVFPNPATEILMINLSDPYKQGTLQLFSMNGQMVQSSLLSGGKSELKVGHLPKGIYFLSISYGEERLTKKVVLWKVAQ